jgi:hypothetical protein
MAHIALETIIAAPIRAVFEVLRIPARRPERMRTSMRSALEKLKQLVEHEHGALAQEHGAWACSTAPATWQTGGPMPWFLARADTYRAIIPRSVLYMLDG